MTVKARTRIGRLVAAGLIVVTIGGSAGARAEALKADDSSTHEAHTLLGGYLAGRVARGENDTPAAARYYGSALEKDPDNSVLLEQSFLLETGAGNWQRAFALAQEVIKLDETHRVARYVLAVKAFNDGDFAAAEEHLAAAKPGPINDLTIQLGQAWIKLAQDKPKEALAALDAIKEAEWSQFYQLYHKGLLSDLAGRSKAAGEALAAAFNKNPRTLRTAEAYARHVMQQGDAKRAKEILRQQIGDTTPHPVIKALLESIVAGAKPERLVRDPAEGLAEVLYGIGDALSSEGGAELGMIYLQLAVLLKPDFDLAHLGIGEIHDASRRPELALQSYAAIGEDSPLWLTVQIRKAFSLNALKRVDEAIALLEAAAGRAPQEIRPLDALGNILRSHERYAEAAEVYGRAIALVKKPKKEHWSLYYARGVCYERLKEWPKAEADLKMALKLDGEQPLVLNYLGYSWVDQGVNLKQAMSLIRKAVKLKPDDGYFVDSLGWAYFRMGDYKAAAEHLERAVELRPEDPVINDHLGDALWHVGREVEARYQWQQALTLNPEPEEVDKIKKKLEEGLGPRKRQASAQPAAAGQDDN